MATLKDLRVRITSVKSTQKITSAMKMVAASKLRRAQDRVQQARPFAAQMQRVLNSLAGRVDQAAHPLLDERTVARAGGRALLFVITAVILTLQYYYDRDFYIAYARPFLRDVDGRRF